MNVKKMSSESNGRNKKIVEYLAIISILLFLSLISMGYFIDFCGESVYGGATSIPDIDSGLMVYIPDSNSTGTGTMPDTEEEPDADVKIEEDVIAKSGHRSGGGGGGNPTTNNDPLPLNLTIKDHDEDYRDGVTATWTMSNMMPGDSVSGWVMFINKGDTAATNLTINCTSVTIDPLGPESDTEENTTDLDKEMIIAAMIYYYDVNKQIDCLSLLNDSNNNGNKDLDDLEAQVIDLPPPGMTDTYATNLSMTLQFNPDAGNNYQGDELNTTFIFTLLKL